MKKKILTICLLGVMALSAIGGTLAYFTDTGTAENTFILGKVDMYFDEPSVDPYDPENPDDPIGEDYEDPIVPGHTFPKDPTVHIEAGSNDSYIFIDMTMNKYNELFEVMALDAYEKNDSFTEAIWSACLDNGNFSTVKFLETMNSEANYPIFKAIVDDWFKDIDHSAWQVCDIFVGCDEKDVTKTGNYLTFRFAYKGDTSNGTKYIVDTLKATTMTEITFMTAFQMPTTVTQEQIAESGFTATEESKFELNFTSYAIQADGLAYAEGVTEDIAVAYEAMFGMTLDTLAVTVVTTTP